MLILNPLHDLQYRHERTGPAELQIQRVDDSSGAASLRPDGTRAALGRFHRATGQLRQVRRALYVLCLPGSKPAKVLLEIADSAELTFALSRLRQ